MQNVKNVKTERVVPLAAVCVQCGSRRSGGVGPAVGAKSVEDHPEMLGGGALVG